LASGNSSTSVASAIVSCARVRCSNVPLIPPTKKERAIRRPTITASSRTFAAAVPSSVLTNSPSESGPSDTTSKSLDPPAPDPADRSRSGGRYQSATAARLPPPTTRRPVGE
jgi:hypothetical protein